MEKITQLAFMALVVLTTLNTYSQTGIWYRENFVPSTPNNSSNLIDSHSDLITDSQQNIYVAFSYNQGGLYVAKFDPNGNIIWNDYIEGFKDIKVRKIKIINNNGTDFLYVAHNIETNQINTLGLTCYNISTGSIVWSYAYEQIDPSYSYTDHELSDFDVDTNGNLLLLAEKLLLLTDKEGNLQSKYGTTDSINRVDMSGSYGSSPDNDTEGLFTNNETLMPFSVGSPLGGTPASINNYNQEKEWEFGVTYTGNDPATGEQLSMDSDIAFDFNNGFAGASTTSFKAILSNATGVYVFATSTIGNNFYQGIVKLDKNDINVMEWSKLWRQSSNDPGKILIDENDDLYVISWDTLFQLNSSAADILINKFDKNGNHLWSKVYGGNGNEVPYVNSCAAIDIVNGRILLNTYSDSYDTGNPKAVVLNIDYDGVLQNFNIVGAMDEGNYNYGLGIALDANGDVYGSGININNHATLYKVNVSTIFNNPAPVFTSTNTATTPDNIDTTTVVLDVEANDGDGGATDTSVTYSLSGDDEDDFTIDPATGEIKFAVAPDFGNPADANGDNVYEISVIADNGNAGNNTTEQVITITVTDSSTLSTEIIDGITDKLNVLVSNNGKDLTIQLKDATEGEVVLYSLIGQQVYQGRHSFVNGSLTINNLNLKKNTIYLLNCKAAGANKTVKFMF